MAKPRALPIIVDDTGAPYTAAAPTVLACVVASTGAARWPTPSVANAGGGKYSVQPSNDDEATGLTMLFDAGAGRWPRYFTLAIHLEDNSNQHMAFHLEAEDGTLWTGAAASISATDAGGGARTAPPVVAAADAPYSTCLFSVLPTQADADAGTFVRIAAPAGAAPPYWGGATEERLTTPWARPSPGPMRNPASDVAELLNGKDAGGLTLTLATNLFKGFVRRADATTSPAVFVANTGGPPPEPYVSGARQSTVRATVQVMVRGAVNEFQAGETVARGVWRWLHQQDVPDYIACYARDAQPVFVGEDDLGHYMWSINLELQYVSTL